MQKERDVAFDVLKGIGILSVMLCHLVYNEGLIHKVVYSFHMPLFFLISGYFVKDANCFVDFLNLTKRNARRLLLPFSVTMFMLVVWGAILAYAKQDVAFFMRPLLSLVLANADPMDTQWGMPYAGCLWFLVALFVARECFALLQITLRKASSKCRSHIILVICIVISWLVSVSPRDGVIAIFNSTRFDCFGFRGCRVVCKANSKRRGMGEMVVCVVLATVNHVWRNQYGELHFERLSLVCVGSMWRGLFVISCFFL